MVGTAYTRCYRHASRCAPGYYPSGNYHIRNNQGSRITQAIRSSQICGFNLMIMTDTKITNHAYFQNSIEYYVLCLKAIVTVDGYAQGGGGGGY